MARAIPSAQPASRRLPSLDSTYSSPFSTIERSYPPVPLDLETVSTAPVYAKFAKSQSQSQIGLNPDQKITNSVSFLQVDTTSPVPSTTDSLLREQQGRELPLPLKQNSKNGHKAAVPSLTIKATDDPFSRPNFDYSPIEAGFANTRQSTSQNSTEKPPASSRASRLFSALRPTPPTAGLLEKPSSAPASRQLAPLHEKLSTDSKSNAFFVHQRNGSKSDQRNGLSSPRTADSGKISVSVAQEDVRDPTARAQEGDAPPTTSAKALDVLIGLPTDAPPKAVSTLTGIQISAKAHTVLLTDESSATHTGQGGQDDDADHSDLDSIASTVRRLPEMHLPRPKLRELAEDDGPYASGDRLRRGSDHSVSSDGSHAAVFASSFPAPPVPAIPGRVLATGHVAGQPQPKTRGDLHALRKAVSSADMFGNSKTGHKLLLKGSKSQPFKTSRGSTSSTSLHSSKSYSEAASQQEGSLRRTLASMYLVSGLPREPSNWSLTDHSDGIEPTHLDSAVPRWFKPEVLGSMVSGGSEEAMEALDGTKAPEKSVRKNRVDALRGEGKKVNKTEMGSIPEIPTLSKEEITKIQAKAIKLSLPRDVEVVAAPAAPPATSHTFSFTLKASSVDSIGSVSGNTGGLKGALGASWDMALAQAARPASTDRDDVTYYGASLIVWTHADKTRTAAIRAAVESGSRLKSTTLARAAKAAAFSRKFGEKLARQEMNALTGIKAGNRGRAFSSATTVTSGEETELQTEAYITESEWEGTGNAPLNIGAVDLPILKSGTFWLPYALTLVSKYPIYDLLTDTLRLSWARYHLNIARHSQTMRKLLEFPAPRPSEHFKIPVDPLADADGAFVMKFPGKVSVLSGTEDIDFQIWPILRCLTPDNLLRIAEIALSPFGKVIFVCRHAYMLNLAVETFRHILEPRGWRGVVHGIVHARDIKVYIEDPGPYLMGIDSKCINFAYSLAPEVCVVDLETNDVRCSSLPPNALSRGAQRDKIVKRLSEAIGPVPNYGIPIELTEAFPGSRFRPFSQVEVNGKVAPAERLLPPANWAYDEARFLLTFDAILAVRPNQSVFSRLLPFRQSARRKASELSSNAAHVQQIVRNQSSNFVDRRDLMEAKLWRMNKKLGSLMQETQSWSVQMDQFQTFTERLNKDAHDMRVKLDKERKEAKRLNSIVADSKQKQSDLADQLRRAEAARAETAAKLEQIESARKEMEEQSSRMMQEMSAILAATDDDDMLEAILEKVEMRLETLSERSAQSVPNNGRMSANLVQQGRGRTGSTLSTQTAPMLEDLQEQDVTAMQRLAIAETVKAIQEKLMQAMASSMTASSLAAAKPARPSRSKARTVRSITRSVSGRPIAGTRRVEVPSSASDSGTDEVAQKASGLPGKASGSGSAASD